MNIEKIIKNSIVNFDGNIAIYYDDLKGNKIKINENEKYNAASCIKIFILIELFNQINKGMINIENIGCYNTKLYSKFKSTENEVFSETTAYDYYLVWKKLNNYELFDKKITQEIIDIIKNQKYHEMVGDGIDKIYKEVENPIVNYIVSKSGKYEAVRNDGGIVSTIYGNYILTIMIKDFKDENYLNDDYVYNMGRKISNIIFNQYIALGDAKSI